jgi:hypothetical protein
MHFSAAGEACPKKKQAWTGRSTLQPAGRPALQCGAPWVGESRWMTDTKQPPKEPCFDEEPKSIPQGLKPVLYFVAFTARLKSCPFKTKLDVCFGWLAASGLKPTSHALKRNKRGPGGPRYSRPGGRRYSVGPRESAKAGGRLIQSSGLGFVVSQVRKSGTPPNGRRPIRGDPGPGPPSFIEQMWATRRRPSGAKAP